MIVVLVSDRFNWRCSNVLSGVGDPYSSSAAIAFEQEAKKKEIDVCTKAEYNAGSDDMSKAIKQIIDNNCCLATVIFGQSKDLALLLVEGQKQGYAGEWIIGNNIVSSLDTVVKHMRAHIDEAATHKLLGGVCEVCFEK